jgi:hypothetical protein
MLFFIWIGRKVNISTLCVGAIGWSLEYRLPIAIYPGHSLLSLAIFEIYIWSDIMLMRTSVSLPLSVDLMSVITSLYSAISTYLCLIPPVLSVYFGIETFQEHIAVKGALRAENKMLGASWLPHQPSQACDDVSTAVFDRALVIVIPFDNLESV